MSVEAISSSAPAVSQPSRVGTETLWLFVGLGRVIFALISDLFQHLYFFFRPLLRNDEQQQWYRQYRLTISPTFSLLRSGLTGVTVKRGKFRYQIRFDSCQRCPFAEWFKFHSSCVGWTGLAASISLFELMGWFPIKMWATARLGILLVHEDHAHTWDLWHHFP